MRFGEPVLGDGGRQQAHLTAGVQNVTDATQENPLLGTEDPFGEDFDASRVYGPLKAVACSWNGRGDWRGVECSGLTTPKVAPASFSLATLCLRMTPREISQSTTSHAMPSEGRT